MLNTRILDELNKQMNAELYSAYLYLSMSAYFESINMAGCANWMRVQAQEEMTHTMKFYSFIVERDGRIKMSSIKAPPDEWNSPLDAFESAYAHEQKVTGMINDLVNIAIEEKDHATNSFLQWFVNEQVEEEATTEGIVQKIKLMGDTSGAMFMLDNELGQRVLVPPTENK